MRELQYRVKINGRKGSIKVKTLAEAREKAQRVGGYYKAVLVDVPLDQVVAPTNKRWETIRAKKLSKGVDI